MNYDNKLYVVYSLPLMGFLSEHGIKYVKARLDKWDPNKMIWLYKYPSFSLKLRKETLKFLFPSLKRRFQL